jgi:sigma-B regulation protein RsbU (phosphoserine phosphatase)
MANSEEPNMKTYTSAGPEHGQGDGAPDEHLDICCFQSALESLNDAVIIADLEGNFLLFNRTAERLLGMGAKNAAVDDWSSTYGCYLPDKVTPFPSRELPLARAIRGEVVSNVEIFIRNPEVPHGVDIVVNARPLKDRNGEVCGGVVVFHDVSVHQETLAVVRRLSHAVELTADVVIITDSRGRIEYVNPAFEKTTGYTSEEALGQTPRLLKSGEHDEHFYQEIWEAILSGRVYQGMLRNRRKDGSLYYAEQTITPMRDRAGSITHFVSVTKDITERLNSAKHEAEMRLAGLVQKKLYPTSAPHLSGFDIAGASYPAEDLCGDYFDYVPMPNGHLGIVIADVSGHGLGPALLMSQVRAYLRSLADTRSDLGDILSWINRTLVADLEDSRFVTMLLARIDPHTQSLVYANAGHPLGYIIDASGEVRTRLGNAGVPLGLFPDSSYSSSAACELRPGDTLLLITDGITDNWERDESTFDIEKVLEFVRSHRHQEAREIVAGLYKACRDHVPDHPQHDDVTLVVCRVSPGSEDPA